MIIKELEAMIKTRKDKLEDLKKLCAQLIGNKLLIK